MHIKDRPRGIRLDGNKMLVDLNKKIPKKYGRYDPPLGASHMRLMIRFDLVRSKYSTSASSILPLHYQPARPLSHSFIPSSCYLLSTSAVCHMYMDRELVYLPNFDENILPMNWKIFRDTVFEDLELSWELCGSLLCGQVH